jgi:hypothetical protein
MEDRMMSAVCFTRCDVISAICWLLNDTFVVPSLHVHYTLLDVIPLRYHFPMHVRIYTQRFTSHCCTCFLFSERGTASTEWIFERVS